MSKTHEAFIQKAATHEMRLTLAKEMGKTVTQIRTLTSYHDLMRVPSINKHVAKIYYAAGVKSVQHLQSLTSSEISQKISLSPLGKQVYIQKDIIQQTIEQSKNTPIYVLDLDNIRGANKDISEPININTQKKRSVVSDFIIFMITIFTLLICSTISWYFLALIPIIIATHILVSSEIVSGLKYKGYEYSMSKIVVVIFSLIFIFGLFFGSLIGNVQRSYDSMMGNTFSTPAIQFYPNEIHQHYKNRDISREELIKLLVAARDVDTDSLSEKNCFEDSFAASFPLEICYAKSKGYVQGDAYNNFQPNESINHGAGLKFILNFYDYDVPRRSLFLTYSDLEKDQWYTTYAEYAKRIGLIPKSVVHFGADESITIEQIDRYVQVLSQG